MPKPLQPQQEVTAMYANPLFQRREAPRSFEQTLDYLNIPASLREKILKEKVATEPTYAVLNFAEDNYSLPQESSTDEHIELPTVYSELVRPVSASAASTQPQNPIRFPQQLSQLAVTDSAIKKPEHKFILVDDAVNYDQNLKPYSIKINISEGYINLTGIPVKDSLLVHTGGAEPYLIQVAMNAKINQISKNTLTIQTDDGVKVVDVVTNQNPVGECIWVQAKNNPNEKYLIRIASVHRDLIVSHKNQIIDFKQCHVVTCVTKGRDNFFLLLNKSSGHLRFVPLADFDLRDVLPSFNALTNRDQFITNLDAIGVATQFPKTVEYDYAWDIEKSRYVMVQVNALYAQPNARDARQPIYASPQDATHYAAQQSSAVYDTPQEVTPRVSQKARGQLGMAGVEAVYIQVVKKIPANSPSNGAASSVPLIPTYAQVNKPKSSQSVKSDANPLSDYDEPVHPDAPRTPLTYETVPDQQPRSGKDGDYASLSEVLGGTGNTTAEYASADEVPLLQLMRNADEIIGAHQETNSSMTTHRRNVSRFNWFGMCLATCLGRSSARYRVGVGPVNAEPDIEMGAVYAQPNSSGVRNVGAPLNVAPQHGSRWKLWTVLGLAATGGIAAGAAFASRGGSSGGSNGVTTTFSPLNTTAATPTTSSFGSSTGHNTTTTTTITKTISEQTTRQANSTTTTLPPTVVTATANATTTGATTALNTTVTVATTSAVATASLTSQGVTAASTSPSSTTTTTTTTTQTPTTTTTRASTTSTTFNVETSTSTSSSTTSSGRTTRPPASTLDRRDLSSPGQIIAKTEYNVPRGLPGYNPISETVDVFVDRFDSIDEAVSFFITRQHLIMNTLFSFRERGSAWLSAKAWGAYFNPDADVLTEQEIFSLSAYLRDALDIDFITGLVVLQQSKVSNWFMTLPDVVNHVLGEKANWKLDLKKMDYVLGQLTINHLGHFLPQRVVTRLQQHTLTLAQAYVLILFNQFEIKGVSDQDLYDAFFTAV